MAGHGHALRGGAKAQHGNALLGGAKAKKRSAEMRIYNRQEAADYLRISTRTLDRRVAENKIPCGRDGRTQFFLETDLDAYVKRTMPAPVVGVMGGTYRRRRV